MNFRIVAGLALWGSLAASASGAPAQNAIRAIEVGEKGAAVELDIRGTRAPSYTVFKLQDPPRLVLDLSGADVSSVPSPMPVGKGGVLGVTTAQYNDARSAVGRVIVALDAGARYEVVPRGESVVVRVTKGEEVAAAEVSSVRAEPFDAAQDKLRAKREVEAPTATPPLTPTLSRGEREKVASPSPTATPPLTPTLSRGEREKAPTATPTDVVARRVDEAAVKHAARSVKRVSLSPAGATVVLDGEVARFEVIELASPPRLALDLYGVEKAPRASVKGAGRFSQARFGKDDGKVRIVLDAAGEMPKYEVKRTAGGIAVVTAASPLTPALSARETHGTPPHPDPLPEGEGSAALRAVPRGAPIADLKFSQAGGAARIEISGRAKYAVSRPDARTVVLSLDAAQLPKKLERSLDTSAFNGPVVMVSSFNQPSSGTVKIIATLRGEAQDKIVETANGLAWSFSAGPAKTHAADEPVVLHENAQEKAAGFTAEAPSYALSGAPQKREYSGRRITLDFHDIEIRNLLRLIADVSKKNIVVADDVSGKVTVSLRNVPWDQALDLVLKTKGLDKEEMGNVIRVAKFEDIAKEQSARAEAAKARAPLVPLKVRLIPVNYAVAGDVEKRVKDVLTERGSVSTDDRTNVLIVKDTQEALARAEGLVRNLDTEIPQVLIESRIIEASSNFNQAIGVQWGGNATLSPATGNPTGIGFPNIASTTGAAGGGPTQGTAANPNYAVNLPAAIGQGSGGGLGFIFGSASGAFNLNLRLSALENSGVVKTISAPKIATIDNRKATIAQGLSIPFSQVSASGVNTTFIEAKLELEVTPHVTADGTILMKIKATNNSPNPQLTGANGQPSISKREAETAVLVKDGDTTVIGGIYTRQTSNHVSEVPVLGKIPVLGFFFRTKTDQDDHTELLIFITPRILNRQPIAGNVSGT